MNFTVYRANGGMMVEYNKYDERKDQHSCELHIVHPDENLGDALAKIVTFESLKSWIKLKEIEQTVWCQKPSVRSGSHGCDWY